MLSNLENRIKTSIVQGVELIEVDLSNTTEAEFFTILKNLTGLLKNVSQEDQKFFLINSEKSPTSVKVIEESKKNLLNSNFSNHYTALYGLNRLRTNILNIINFVHSYNVQSFSSKEKAQQYLIDVAKTKKALVS